jgi:(E)-4-hydroxy-3-methylbut-2-enyl-diphosphate synthase
LLTREIYIGSLSLGGNKPVRIQSMTNTPTLDTDATVKQSLQLAHAGCEMIRITARNTNEAENLNNIKLSLGRHGCNVPLIADIHFQPEAALVAARIVEKVRINPGNYVDKKQNLSLLSDYSERDYQIELEKIRFRLLPLIKVCQEYGTAIRIGVNHGSLSDRILQRFGDTPEGMVASALEFIEIFAAEGFHKLVLSMKSSNVKTMIYSYRLLAKEMSAQGYDYPLHLGVTEAGAGADARIKSAAGIGELLMEGLGNTIRVSLTEDPVREIPVAIMLRNTFAAHRDQTPADFYRGFSYIKSETIQIAGFGSDQPPVAVSTEKNRIEGAKYQPEMYWNMKESYLQAYETLQIVPLTYADARGFEAKNISPNLPTALLFDISRCINLPRARQQLFAMKKAGNTQPIVLYKNYRFQDIEELTVKAAAEFSYFLTDGLINGICIQADDHKEMLTELMFQILQAMGLRRVKAEFIACPTCGRTSYDVEGTLGKISEKLSHLKHLKIGVMGCIVNGPGEMADADYGYVGSGPGKVNLYKGRSLISKNIDEDLALEELIGIIKQNGDWVDETE